MGKQNDLHSFPEPVHNENFSQLQHESDQIKCNKITLLELLVVKTWSFFYQKPLNHTSKSRQNSCEEVRTKESPNLPITVFIIYFPGCIYSVGHSTFIIIWYYYLQVVGPGCNGLSLQGEPPKRAECRWKQNMIGWPTLSVSLRPFSATKLVTAPLSFDNRWANGFCHLTPTPTWTHSGRHTQAACRHPLRSQHNQLSDQLGLIFLTFNWETNTVTLFT